MEIEGEWVNLIFRLYLMRHPKIDYYCVIDDDDLGPKNSDLNKVRNHLVQTIYYSDKPEEEGLLELHIDKVGEALKEDNEIKRLVLKRKKN